MEVYFVTGTGTDVGKTYCAAQFVETCRAAGRRVGVYKPVASGCELGDDGERLASDASVLWHAAGCPSTLDQVCPQRFIAPLAPPQAAIAEGVEVDQTLLMTGVEAWAAGGEDASQHPSTVFDVLVIEGAGGLFSPLATSLLNIDFALQLKERFPQMYVVLIARNRLGVIHECVATVRAAIATGLSIDKIVLNEFANEADESIATNSQQVEHWTGCPVAEMSLETIVPSE
ncbi:dethiobiotin synthase [Allorhodopirellula heiligendammensis]|uniref:ATP-dependent dethiobiotin synthetase BioD n=1 Tax=Allorhodopirellula heiligendammensis TaxID=2714739 RepID=A0A5C6BHE1_9BACT|nr:dethiobiotin synthase [Allorhodopirellula heiligendammensis]TWU09874.1 ATP-dependent dethiobiotin synthetase BioD 1 [Allorhodopirellula heiligendammensis]